MSKFKRFVSYARDFKGYFALNVTFNILGVVFTMIGMSTMMPLIEILFKSDISQINDFLAPNPHLDFSREFLEYEVNHWFAGMIDGAPSFNEGKKEALYKICLLISGAFLFKNLFLYLAQFFLAPIRNGMIAKLRNDVYKKMLRLPVSFFNNEKKGDLMSRMTNDVGQIEWGMVSLQKIVREPIQIIVFIYGLFFISVKLTLVVLLLLPITAIVVSIIGKGLKRTSKKAQGKLGQVLSVVEESITAVKVIKGFAVEKIFTKDFEEHNQRFYTLTNRQIRKRTASSPISETIGIGVFALVMWVGGNIVFDSENGLSGSTLITYLAFMWGLLAPLKSITASLNALQVAYVSLERVDDILDADEKNEMETGGLEINGFEDKIELTNVRFKYEEEEVLKGINLNFEKGKTYALVGESGSGKSTLADLVPRFNDVTDGVITVDGKDVREINIQSLRRLTGIVTQDSILFNDTVRQNLSLGVENVSDEDFTKALKIANAYDFVSELEHGIDSVIGEGGGKLSGGQRQRLCIARAVLLNPPLLILDEATSALDTASEKLVQEALEKVMEGRTAIVIAHRLSTIRNADKIVVLDKGNIAEEGSHNELFAKQGHYYKLCNLQNIK
ncbi:ABC transporter ATP-binding protein/permease [Flavobacteriales bacterium]|nr:ABC transporter ATP-binding protein/permease [Flavobacteriales bacterium]